MTIHDTDARFNINRADAGLLLNDLGLIGEGVEIGVDTALWSTELLSKWKGKRIYGIDCYMQQPKEIYYEIYSPPGAGFNAPTQQREMEYIDTLKGIFKLNNTNRYYVIRAFSNNAAYIFENYQLDFVYVDGNHSYEGVKEDLEVWYPKIKIGGLIFGDDWEGPSTYGVANAVDEFFNKWNKKVYTGKGPDAAGNFPPLYNRRQWYHIK